MFFFHSVLLFRFLHSIHCHFGLSLIFFSEFYILTYQMHMHKYTCQGICAGYNCDLTSYSKELICCTEQRPKDGPCSTGVSIPSPLGVHDPHQVWKQHCNTGVSLYPCCVTLLQLKPHWEPGVSRAKGSGVYVIKPAPSMPSFLVDYGQAGAVK